MNCQAIYQRTQSLCKRTFMHDVPYARSIHRPGRRQACQRVFSER